MEKVMEKKMHNESSDLAGKTVRIKEGVRDPMQAMVLPGELYRIEDWWDKLTGKSWQEATGNIAALKYAIRAAYNFLSPDDEVLYGHIGAFGHLVHISEIEEV